MAWSAGAGESVVPTIRRHGASMARVPVFVGASPPLPRLWADESLALRTRHCDLARRRIVLKESSAIVFLPMFRPIFLPLLLALLGVRACAADPPNPALPQSPELAQWFSLVRDVEAGLENGAARFTFQMKKMHVHAKVLRDETVVGALRTETSSTCVDGEIASFSLARVLGCGELFQPAAPFTLRGKGLATFQNLMVTARFPEAKERDRRQVLRDIADNPDGLRAGFRMATPLNAEKYFSIEDPALPPNGGLNEQDRVAVFLKCGSPQPGAAELKLKHLDVRAPAVILARELSDILLVDALAGQWDRFSGGNLHVVVTDGRAHFLAVDNGGANFLDDQGNLARFKKTVTRFDRRVVERLFALEEFLAATPPVNRAAKRKDFLGFTTEEALADAMSIAMPEDWESLRVRVREVAAHVRSIGEGAYFAE